ncbi:MAG: rane fusion protein multidrug efflux system, partial [Sphingomonadales bacterium]|nr:rane fusion protein multidrug efflux system [Sphingomonadales bacterium]
MLLLPAVLAACGSGEKAAAPPPPPVAVAAPLVREVVDWDDYVGRF